MRAASVKMASGAVAMVLILAACGGNGGGAPTGPVPPPEPADAQAPEDPRSDAERQADQEAAEAAVLTIDDFDAFEEPWEAIPSEDGEDDGEEGAGDDNVLDQVATCLGVRSGLFGDDNPEAGSAFQAPDGPRQPFVTVQVTLAASGETMARAMDVLHRDQAPTCFGTVVEDNFIADDEEAPSDVRIGETLGGRLEAANLGDDVAAFRATTPTTPVDSEGQPLLDNTIDVLADLTVLQAGRVGIAMLIQSRLEGLPSDQVEQLMQAVLDRLPNDVVVGAELATEE